MTTAVEAGGRRNWVSHKDWKEVFSIWILTTKLLFYFCYSYLVSFPLDPLVSPDTIGGGHPTVYRSVILSVCCFTCCCCFWCLNIVHVSAADVFAVCRWVFSARRQMTQLTRAQRKQPWLSVFQPNLPHFLSTVSPGYYTHTDAWWRNFGTSLQPVSH